MVVFIQGLFEDWVAMLSQGGVVMWPLVGLTVALWFALGYRMVILDRGTSARVRRVIDTAENESEHSPKGVIDTAAVRAYTVRKNHSGEIRRFLDDELFSLSEQLGRYRTLARTIVLVAPLAGLLGTVVGMIEMFESLGSRTFYSQSGGVANGISQALFTTQFGLVIAIPGMIVGRLFDRREHTMREEIEQIKDYFNSKTGSNDEVFTEEA